MKIRAFILKEGKDLARASTSATEWLQAGGAVLVTT
jgi:hypothetical protein